MSKRGGKPNPRPKGMPTPCHKCPKIPDGEDKVRGNAQSLNAANALAFRHYRECRAVGEFPADDPIVRRNARIIRDTLEAIEREDRQFLTAKLGVLALGATHART